MAGHPVAGPHPESAELPRPEPHPEEAQEPSWGTAKGGTLTTLRRRGLTAMVFESSPRSVASAAAAAIVRSSVLLPHPLGPSSDLR